MKKKTLANKILKNSMYGKFGTGTISIDIESKFNWDHSLSFLKDYVSCKTCKPILVGGIYHQTKVINCPECGGDGIRKRDWVENLIIGKIDEVK